MSFDSGQLHLNRFLVHYICHTKISNFVENFELSIVQFESIQVLDLLSSKPILDFESGMASGRSIRVFGLKLVLLGLFIA